ncbi:Transcription initiation factor TFIID subunit 13 [Fusarium oxysporum f. sp. albedinis]|nr:Transcription initiation factor TFIID subunit 13 [Fusarium oxysporum f. sp. albedinis]
MHKTGGFIGKMLRGMYRPTLRASNVSILMTINAEHAIFASDVRSSVMDGSLASAANILTSVCLILAHSFISSQP